MEISILTLKLIILLTPGALATIIFRKLTIRHKEFSDFMFVIFSIIFGMFSYLILQVLCFINTSLKNFFSDQNLEYHSIKTFEKLSDSNIIPYKEVIYASIISVLLGLIIACLDHYKILNRISRKLHISNKYGDENLYTYFLNSPDINWVYIRDIDKGLTYLGNVQSFSETNEHKEIVLGQVTVFTYPESNELYELDRIYLVFPKDRVIIEQAKLN